jgi:hypothetical protein
MALKISKGVWFLSMLAALAALLFAYAGLPQQVLVQDDEGARVTVSNEIFFYLVMMLIAVTNVMVYIMAKVFKQNEDLRTWFNGLVTTLNVFFIIGVNYISLYNSSEKFDYERIAFIIYGSLSLVVLWAAAWPVLAVFKRLNNKLMV